VLYDVAFTLMDLWLSERRDLANLLFNRYASALFRTLPDLPSAVRDGFAALPFFMALRAAIRAHIAASQALSCADARDAAHRDEARAYFALAADLLAPRSQVLVAIGGLSGSGKSTMAAAIAAEFGPPPGARTLNSDRTRKAMHRIGPDQALPPTAYEITITAAVYLRLMSRAMDALAQGAAVIVDAVYSTEAERAAIAKIAEDKRVPFVGLWLETDPEILRKRIEQRPKGPSDANVAVLEAQLARGVGRIDWIRIDSSRPDATQQVLRVVHEALAKGCAKIPAQSPATP
jgi:predicted kinase